MHDDQHDDECGEDIRNTGACRHGHAFPEPEGGCGRPGCEHDRGITPERAQGMLDGIKASHTCTEACTGTIVLGDGKTLTLTCPYTRLDVNSATDRKVIGTVYADIVRATMGSTFGAVVRTMGGAR